LDGKPVEVGVVCGERDDAPPPAPLCPPLDGCGGARSVETRSRPARRDIRSARSASRLVVDGLCWCPRSRPGPWGKWPRWPSLMAVVERALNEVVVLVGVPGISEGVSGLDPGGGRLMKVGCDACAMANVSSRIRGQRCLLMCIMRKTQTQYRLRRVCLTEILLFGSWCQLVRCFLSPRDGWGEQDPER
jgi:hypothetical protein